MFVSKSKGSFTDTYRLIGKYLEEGFMVVYGAASESPDVSRGKFVKHVVEEISESAKVKDLGHKLDTGALKVLDIRRIFAEKNARNPSELLKKWAEYFMETRESMSFKGIVVIAGGVGTFKHTGAEFKLVSYEQTISRRITELGSALVICCYQPESLKRLAFSSLVAIAAAHRYIMSDRMEYREISKSVLLEAVDLGIENVLGAESARLILRTMKMIYGLDENAILSTPKVFEEKLCKLLGHASAPVLASISYQVILLLRARAGEAHSASHNLA